MTKIQTVIETSEYVSTVNTNGGLRDQKSVSEFSSPMRDSADRMEAHVRTMAHALVDLSVGKRVGRAHERTDVIKAIYRVLEDTQLVKRFGFEGDLYMSEKDPDYARYRDEVLTGGKPEPTVEEDP